MLATIEWDKIGELLYVAPLAGLAVALSYALMIVGWARAGEARRAGAGGTAVAYSALGTLATLAFLAVVVFGVTIIIKK
jgi:TRAP-type mannitol/chloroaromatic compound transport system permease small subunit